MFHQTAPAFPIERCEIHGADITFSSGIDGMLMLVIVERTDLMAVLGADRDIITATCDLEGSFSETVTCEYRNGTLYTSVGAIAMDYKAVSEWLLTAQPGDFWERPHLATA